MRDRPFFRYRFSRVLCTDSASYSSDPSRERRRESESRRGLHFQPQNVAAPGLRRAGRLGLIRCFRGVHLFDIDSGHMGAGPVIAQSLAISPEVAGLAEEDEVREEG